jgi:hypothetical protein
LVKTALAHRPGGEQARPFTAWSSFAHVRVMGLQAMRNMISRGELAGVALLVVIGVALIALPPAEEPSDHASAVAVARRPPVPLK